MSNAEASGTGDRLRQVANGVTTTYQVDLNAGLSQVLNDGSNTYLYGASRLAQYAGANADYFLPDGLGSVRQLANSAGSVTLAQRYNPFGGSLSSAGAGSSVYGFTPAVSTAGAGGGTARCERVDVSVVCGAGEVLHATAGAIHGEGYVGGGYECADVV